MGKSSTFEVKGAKPDCGASPSTAMLALTGTLQPHQMLHE